MVKNSEAIGFNWLRHIGCIGKSSLNIDILSILHIEYSVSGDDVSRSRITHELITLCGHVASTSRSAMADAEGSPQKSVMQDVSMQCAS